MKQTTEFTNATPDEIEAGDTIKWSEEWTGDTKTFVAEVTNVRTVEIDEPFTPTKTLRKFELSMIEGDASQADPSLEYPNAEDTTPEIDNERFEGDDSATLQVKENTDADARTDTKRFDAEEFSAADLIEGDRINPSLVTSTMDGLGEQRSADPDAGVAQLAEATITNGMDDVHQAILVDGESGLLVRASRHDSQGAWSQQEADWKVHEIGTRVAVTDAEVEQDGNDEWDDVDAAEEAEAWTDVVLGDRARGSTDYQDEVTLTGKSSLTLREPYGPTKVHATIEFKTDE